MWRYLAFSFSEAITNLWRARVLNVLAVGTIMFAMFILGSFLLVGTNLKKVSLQWKSQIQFNVFLADDAATSDVTTIRQTLEEHFFVEQVAFISKDDARVDFRSSFPAYRDAVGVIQSNPFPASFKVFLVKGAGREAFDDLVAQLDGVSGVEEIYYDEDVYQQLSLFAGLINFIGIFFGAIMVCASVFTISNVLKLTFFARREEVDIMKLVGASRAYIRGPFILEGMLQGLMGAGLGVLLVLLGYLLLDGYLVRNPESLLSSLELAFLSSRWIFVLILAGVVSGLLGALFSLNQFLEEHISYQ